MPPCQLLISAGTGDARVHLTEYKFENPAAPPMFCMLLRKHLMGAKIAGIAQPDAERIIEFEFEAPDAMGVLAGKRLVVEMIGRISNIVLVDDKGLIIDCLRRISDDQMAKRAVLPGLIYNLPPPQEGKLDPMTITDDIWRKMFNVNHADADAEYAGLGEASYPGGTVDKWLLTNFSSLSPLICREISARAYGETDFRIENVRDGGAALRDELFALIEIVKAGDYEPWAIMDADGRSKDFSFMRISQYGDAYNLSRAAGFSVMLDEHFTREARIARFKQRISATSRSVRTARDRLVRKLATQHDELARSADRDRLRENGDIITANMHLLAKGRHELVAPDFFAEAGEAGEDAAEAAEASGVAEAAGDVAEAGVAEASVDAADAVEAAEAAVDAAEAAEASGVVMRTIALDPLKTPQQNAAKYYKDYTKAKNAERFLTEQIEQGESELQYLESVLVQIDLAENELDMEEIRRELAMTGYLKMHGKGMGGSSAGIAINGASRAGNARGGNSQAVNIKGGGAKAGKPKGGNARAGSSKGGSAKARLSRPMRFLSSGGCTIYAGKNNTQNEELSHKLAARSDIWLHAQKLHGSHVVICPEEGTAPDDNTIFEAATIAAYYSSARGGGKTPVDYTQIKFLKKARGGKPGMVLYTDYKTIIVTPDEELVNRLRQDGSGSI